MNDTHDSTATIRGTVVLPALQLPKGLSALLVPTRDLAVHEAAPDLLAALKAMVASYDGLRDALTCPTVITKLADADAAIAKAEGGAR